MDEGSESKVRPLVSIVEATHQAILGLPHPLDWKEIEWIAHEDAAAAALRQPADS